MHQGRKNRPPLAARRKRAESPEGRYANCFEVGHNAFEFVLDFGQKYDEREAGATHTRIVTSPSYAKALQQTLAESLQRYEREFGALEGAEPKQAG
jgi:hypothetical protein